MDMLPMPLRSFLAIFIALCLVLDPSFAAGQQLSSERLSANVMSHVTLFSQEAFSTRATQAVNAYCAQVRSRVNQRLALALAIPTAIVGGTIFYFQDWQQAKLFVHSLGIYVVSIVFSKLF